MNRQERAQERDVVDRRPRAAVMHADFGRPRGRPLELVALHEKSRDRTTEHAGEDEPRRRAQHADFERVAEMACAAMAGAHAIAVP